MKVVGTYIAGVAAKFTTPFAVSQRLGIKEQLKS
jgi:hypothetical protein